MNIISKQQAKDMLLGGSGRALNGEQLVNYHKQLIEDDTVCTTFESHGCVIFKYVYQYDDIHRFVWNIHTIDDKSDIISALKDNPELCGDAPVEGYIIGNFPVEIDKKKHYGWLTYLRFGEYYIDGAIRIITENDSKMMDEFCTKRDDDNWYTCIEKKNFLDIFNLNDKEIERTILGLFENKELAGLILVESYDEINMARLSDIIVKKECRRKGYAKRIIKAACAVYPGKEYWYNVAWHNEASIATAKSAGLPQ